MLSGHYVGCVRVSFLDTSTLAGRSGYFDSVGITRDILQVRLKETLALALTQLLT